MVTENKFSLRSRIKKFVKIFIALYAHLEGETSHQGDGEGWAVSDPSTAFLQDDFIIFLSLWRRKNE